MMKKFTLLLAFVALFTIHATAAIYLVGNAPFGNGWDPSNGIEMTSNGDGTYTYTATLTSATVWFVFSDGLASSSSDWDTFNGTYRYGPTTGSNQTVTVDTETTTQRQGNGNGSYQFTGTAGNSYTITFDANNLTFKISGTVEEITDHTYTVAGSLTDILGTSWDVGNTDNDMTKGSDGIYTLTKSGISISGGTTLEFKVALDHDWGTAYPSSNYSYTFDETATYDITFTFNPETNEVGITVTKVSEGEVVDPYNGKLYILGQVNGNNWDPSAGIEMSTTDEKVFTLEGATFSDAGDGYAYFSFTSKLGASSDDWSFTDYRRGAVSSDYEITTDMIGTAVQMGDFGTTDAFKVLAGTYDVTVDLYAGTVTLSAGKTSVYLLGNVSGDWSASEGTEMEYDESTGEYSTSLTTVDSGDGHSYVGFTKKLADSSSETPWDDIASYRFGPLCDGASDTWTLTAALVGVDCELATDGSYYSVQLPVDVEASIFVNLTNNTFRVEIEGYKLDVTSCKYATMYLDYPVVIPDDENIYSVMYVYETIDEGEAATHKITGYIPTNTGVIVNAVEGTYFFPKTVKSVDAITNNMLFGTVSEITVEAAKEEAAAQYIYTLADEDGADVGFYNFTGETLKANRAYLPLDDHYAKVNILAPDDGTTGINGIDNNTEVKDNKIYNLNGQQLSQPQKGINIINGKKVIVR